MKLTKVDICRLVPEGGIKDNFSHIVLLIQTSAELVNISVHVSDFDTKLMQDLSKNVHEGSCQCACLVIGMFCLFVS